MGFLDKIGSLFSRKLEKEKFPPVKVEHKEIDSLLERKDKEINELIKEKSDILYSNLLKILDKLEKDIQKLSRIDIDKIKADPKLKSVTKMGIDDYISLSNNLIKNLRVKKEGTEEFGYIIDKVQEFRKYAAKSHFKATYLVGKEAATIIEQVGEIFRLAEDFGKNNQRLFEEKNKMMQLLKRNKEKNHNINARNVVVEELKTLNKNYEINKEKLKDLEKKLDILKEGPKYREIKKLIEEKSEKEDVLRGIRFTVKTLIDKKDLKKYLYIASDKTERKLLENYIEDPVEALMSDEGFQMLKILENIGKSINEKTLIVKDPKKSLEKLNLGKNTFQDYKKKTTKLTGEIKKLNKSINELRTPLNSILKEKKEIENIGLTNRGQFEIVSKRLDKINRFIEESNNEIISRLGPVKD